VTRADLHAHSRASDGLFPPLEVVRRAYGAGIGALALTDHDTLAGLDEARREAERLGLAFVPGCEVSVDVAGRDIHVLAYFVTADDPRLQALLAGAERMRDERMRATLQRLARAGVRLDEAEVRREAAASRAIGRLHVARALVARRHVETLAEAFLRYLGSGACAQVPKRTPSAAETLRAIWDSGAVPVLAHPGLYGLEQPERFFADWDLGGIEACHPGHDRAAEERFAHWADERGVIVTGGSDWHGEERPAAYLGCRTVEVSAIEALRSRRRPAPRAAP
jgi:hypothetical protein